MSAYYNENDAKTAAWLRELIKKKLIADGEVDTRSIVEVQPADLAGFTQCHFFAGIGGWSYALRLAGWPDEREIWTGSCPCQPFSSAGTQAGGDDARDLWPAWFRLIAQRRPRVITGEQVESAIGHGWIDRLCDDLEGEGYAVGPIGLPAASVGTFHLRPRLWFVADTDDAGPQGRIGAVLSERPCERAVGPRGASGDMADPGSQRRDRERLRLQQRQPRQDRLEVAWRGEVGELEQSEGERHCRPTTGGRQAQRRAEYTGELGDANSLRETPLGGISGRPIPECERSPWAGAEWIACRDGKSRPVEPGTFPLAHGLPARVGRLRGYGNAIVPHVAAEVIAAYMEICDMKESPLPASVGRQDDEAPRKPLATLRKARQVGKQFYRSGDFPLTPWSDLDKLLEVVERGLADALRLPAVSPLRDQLQALRDEFYAALVIMRNYYAQAISRVAVDEILDRGWKFIKQTDVVLADALSVTTPPQNEAIRKARLLGQQFYREGHFPLTPWSELDDLLRDIEQQNPAPSQGWQAIASKLRDASRRCDWGAVVYLAEQIDKDAVSSARSQASVSSSCWRGRRITP